LPIDFVKPNLAIDSTINNCQYKYIYLVYYNDRNEILDSLKGFYRIKSDSIYFINEYFVANKCYSESLIGILREDELINGKKIKQNDCFIDYSKPLQFPHNTFMTTEKFKTLNLKNWKEYIYINHEVEGIGYLPILELGEETPNFIGMKRSFIVTKKKGIIGYKFEKYNENFIYDFSY
jgi:hypothetical protein